MPHGGESCRESTLQGLHGDFKMVYTFGGDFEFQAGSVHVHEPTINGGWQTPLVRIVAFGCSRSDCDEMFASHRTVGLLVGAEPERPVRVDNATCRQAPAWEILQTIQPPFRGAPLESTTLPVTL